LPNAPWRDLAVAPTWASSPQPRFSPTTPFRDSLQGLRTTATTRVNSNCKSVRALQNTLAKCCCSPGNKPDGRTGLASDPKLDGPGSGSPAETRATNFPSRRISILRWVYDFIDIFWNLLGCKIITTKTLYIYIDIKGWKSFHKKYKACWSKCKHTKGKSKQSKQ
jgi:hypothetical protein